MEQQEFIGRGSIKYIDVKGRVLFFAKQGRFEAFQHIWNPILSNCDVTFYGNMTENPKREEIQQAQDYLSGQKFDVIVAFGGGSVIDFAKAFRFYDKRNIKLIAVPTTAGTGSEATQFAVVYIDGNKTSLDNPIIRPDIAVVDSQFSETAPKSVKAPCAMDVLCQAIESYWSKKATDESQRYALSAITLCRDWLVKAVLSYDKLANEKMAEAAHLSGKAINISRTTAAHAVSYKMTSVYGIPHGHAVAISIANLFVKNLGHFDNEDALMNAMGIKPNEIKEYFRKLMKTIGLEYDLEKLGIHDIDEIVKSVNVERLQNNPYPLNSDDLKSLLIDGE